MRKTSKELIDAGVDQSLVEERDELNRLIKEGKLTPLSFSGTDKKPIALYAFISNPFGYDRVFIECDTGEKALAWEIKHG